MHDRHFATSQGEDARAGPLHLGGDLESSSWRMPPQALLSPPAMSAGRKIGMSALRAYLAVAMILVFVKIAQLAIGIGPARRIPAPAGPS